MISSLIGNRWPIYLIGLSWTVPMVSIADDRSLPMSWCFHLLILCLLIKLPRQTPETSYLTLTLKSLGFGTFETNLLTIPSSVLFIIQLIFWTWLSERLNQRFALGLISQLWTIPLLVALEVLPKKFAHANWVRYAISSLIVGYPYAHAALGTLKASPDFF